MILIAADSPWLIQIQKEVEKMLHSRIETDWMLKDSDAERLSEVNSD